MTNDTMTLQFDSILLKNKSNHVKKLYQDLSTHVNRLIGTPQDKILQTLLSNEQEMSSAIGKGIAIPHMKLPRLTRPMVIFATLNEAIDFKSNDGEWVDMVCLVLSPEFEGPKHLQRLAFVTRTLKNKNFCDALRNSENIEDIRNVIVSINAEKIAA